MCKEKGKSIRIRSRAEQGVGVGDAD